MGEELKTVVFDACHLAVKDGHIVAECDSLEASEELAKLLMEEVFIRVKPKGAVTEPPAPVGKNPPMSQQPEPEPDTRLNPTES